MRGMCRLLVLAAMASVVAGCQGGGGNAGTREGKSLTIYSGRNEKLIGPLLDRFGESSGIEVRVRYGSTPEMVATLLEEGTNTPADLFISQDAAALETLSRAGLLAELPDEIRGALPAGFRSGKGDWIGLSGRARCLVYNTERVKPEQLPQSLEDFAGAELAGPFGVAPGNASFQAQMAAYLVANGEQALAELLAGMAGNRPRTYPKNSPIVQAVIDGELDWGLVNHYYLMRALAEDPDAPAKNYLMPQGAASKFVDMAGAGILSDGAAARELMAFLVSERAQRYFADETFEFPLAENLPSDLHAPEELELASRFDYAAISEALEQTQTLIHESGLTRFQ